jgi:N-hydroxyarylamine O-acetyltransferase
VLWNVPKGTITPRSHMLLRIDIDATPFIADVGFGGLTLTAPLALTADVAQTTPHEPFRLILSGLTYTLQAFMGQEWKSLYYFDLQEQQLPDYEVSNWYISTHPNSLFTTSLIVAKPDAKGRYALRNNHLIRHDLEGRTERRLLTTAAELQSVLEDVFHLQLPAIANLDSLLKRIVDQIA